MIKVDSDLSSEEKEAEVEKQLTNWLESLGTKKGGRIIPRYSRAIKKMSILIEDERKLIKTILRDLDDLDEEKRIQIVKATILTFLYHNIDELIPDSEREELVTQLIKLTLPRYRKPTKESLSSIDNPMYG